MKKLRNNITFKSISGVILLLVLFAVIVSAVGYRAFTDALYEQYSGDAFHIADSAATMVNADQIDSYMETGGTSEEYQDSWKRLDRLCNSADVTFIYVIQPDLTDYAHISFVFSTVNHKSSYTPYEVGFVRETTNDEYKEKYRALYSGESERELIFLAGRQYSSSVHHLTAMVPLKTSDGQTAAILCVQRQMDAVSPIRRDFVRSVMRVLLLLAAVVTVGQAVYLSRVLIRPVKKITDEATRFATENCPPERKLTEEITNSDEIGQLASSIDRMEEQIGDYIESLTRITAERERIAAELSLAGRIQDAMLPNDFPAFPDRDEFALYASMDPAKEVGGDFYDFFLIDEDHLCLEIADVSGKGIPAAMFMTVSKTILQSCAMLGRSAAEILTKTNEAICSNNREDMFVTVWVGILEISTGKMRAASAGHEYPALKKANGSFELFRDRHGLPIGAMENAKYQEYELQFHPGDALFVYTDGIPEAVNEQTAAFGTDRMLDALNLDPNADPETLLHNVRQALDSFVGAAEQFDDITMLGFVYRGPDGSGEKKPENSN